MNEDKLIEVRKYKNFIKKQASDCTAFLANVELAVKTESANHVGDHAAEAKKALKTFLSTVEKAAILFGAKA